MGMGVRSTLYHVRICDFAEYLNLSEIFFCFSCVLIFCFPAKTKFKCKLFVIDKLSSFILIQDGLNGFVISQILNFNEEEPVKENFIFCKKLTKNLNSPLYCQSSFLQVFWQILFHFYLI